MSVQSGYLLVNKPRGMSSFFALREVQKKFRDELGGQKVKMGHAGTLDPLAEGLLLCGVEQGTKILSEMILSKKSYTAEIFLGTFSQTDDEEGEKFLPEEFLQKRDIRDEKNIPDISEIETLLQEKFSGKIIQTPPMYSALKISGKRACDRVRNAIGKDENKQKNRAGSGDTQFSEEKIQEEMQKKSRAIEIFSIKILEYKFPKLKIFVECGSGTYIRSLARDIGQELSTGAYLTFLRRDTVGDFVLQNSVVIDDVKTSDIQSFTVDHFDLEKITLNEEEENRVKNGQRIRFFEAFQKPKKVLMLTSKNKIIGFGEKDGFLLRPRKIFYTPSDK
jgi:tRNA pseudouridine55 synthase